MSRYLKTDTDEIYDGITRSENPDWTGWTIIDHFKANWDNYEDVLNSREIAGLHDAVELYNIEHPIPPDYTDIEDVVAEYEKDDERREALEQARAKLHEINQSRQ